MQSFSITEIVIIFAPANTVSFIKQQIKLNGN